MKFTIPIKELKALGYKFQKLYARDYITYRKKIGSYTIWLWSLGKSLEVNDWYGNTAAVINFYKANRENPQFDLPRAELFGGGTRDYIKVQMNPETGHVQLFDQEEYFKVFHKVDVKNCWDEWEEKYGTWHNEIILRRDEMDELIKEIEVLTK